MGDVGLFEGTAAAAAKGIGPVLFHTGKGGVFRLLFLRSVSEAMDECVVLVGENS